MSGNRSSAVRLVPLEKPIIYFGCSMLGGCPHVSREELAEFPGLIRSLGCELASDHQTQPGVIEAEACLDPTYIHDRDFVWLLESHAGVFETSNPSLGVGGEISDMIHMGKPVLLLYQEKMANQISAYIRGKSGSKFVRSAVVCQPYKDMATAREIIDEFIEAHVSLEAI